MTRRPRPIFAIFTATLAVLILGIQAPAGLTLDPERVFQDAREAYDDSRVEEALDHYESLAKSGYVFPALFFNMGNVHFKQGDLGRAVLQYRRAQYLAPLDADIRGNFKFALQQARAVEPVVSPPVAFFSSLTRAQWGAVAVGAYWLVFIFIACWFLFKRLRDLWRRLIWTALVLLAVGVAGRLHWNGLYEQPEWVAIDKDQQALYAPLEGSSAHFDLPPGSIVREVERQPGWIKVRSGKNAGWIKEKHFAKVYPWS